MEENENITREQLRYMTILLLLVSFLSILGLFLLSRIYWKDAAVAEVHKSSVSFKQSDKALIANNYRFLSFLMPDSNIC